MTPMTKARVTMTTATTKIRITTVTIMATTHPPK